MSLSVSETVEVGTVVIVAVAVTAMSGNEGEKRQGNGGDGNHSKQKVGWRRLAVRMGMIGNEGGIQLKEG